MALSQLCFSSRGQEFFASLLLILWLAVSCVFLALFLLRYMRAVRVLLQQAIPSRKGEQLLQQIQKQFPRKITVSVLLCSGVKAPMGLGLFHQMILLPCAKYSQEELRNILLHEYTHFHAGDLWIRFFLCLFQGLFWWNPAVYLLQNDVEELLELRCDLHVTENMSVREKAAYLDVVLKAVKQADGIRTSGDLRSFVPLGGGRGRRSLLVERFHLVMEPSVQKRKSRCCITWVLAVALLVVSYSFIPQAAAARPDDQAPEWTIAIGAVGETTMETRFLVTQLSQEQVLQLAQETGWEVAFQEGALQTSLSEEE